MPTVTLLLRREATVRWGSGRRVYLPEPEDVELDDLTPRARALAEAFAQYPDGRPRDVVMEQDARIRDVVPAWEAHYPERGDERPREVFRNWSRLRPSRRAYEAVEASEGAAVMKGSGGGKGGESAVHWLEYEARTWPLDWYVVSAVGHDPVPSWEAGAADRYLTPDTALEYLRNARHPLGGSGGLFHALSSTPYLRADRVVCGVRQWRPETLDALMARPVTLWPVSEIAAYLGYTGPSATGTTRKELHRWELSAAGRQPGRGGESLYDADQVKALHAARPGSGRRGAARVGGRFTEGSARPT